MANFSRQPQLPPHPQPRAAEEPTRRPGAPRPPSQPMAHFAILGLDHQTGENISTVIEARSENDAQEMALRLGITVHEFKPMHPLAGAAAVKMARSDPRDRFNQHPSYAQSAGLTQDDGERESIPHPPAPGEGVPGSVRQPTTSNPLGSLAVVGVVGFVAALLYLTVLRDGGAQQVMAMIAPAPPPVEAAFDVTEPLGVDLRGVEGFEDWSPDKSIGQIKTPLDTKLRLEATIPPKRSERSVHGVNDSGGTSGGRGSAVIGGQIITPGQTIAGYRLIQVRDGMVLLQKNGKVLALRIANRSN
ncbi:MAG: hypothetical protein AAF086_07525 [Planctomycetota bacterium]